MKHLWWIICLGFLGLSSHMICAQVQEGTVLSQWSLDTLVGSKEHNNSYNEVWGLAVGASEYAVIGSVEGTHLINVSDPRNPTEDFFFRGASSGEHIIHRDYHDFKGYLYAISDEDTGVNKSTLQIIDTRNLPNSAELVYDSRDRIRKAHNIFIDSSTQRLYAFTVRNGDDPYSPLRIYDISDPINPTFLASYRNGIGSVNVGHVHDGFVKDNIAFLNAGFDGLVIVDFSDVENPEVLYHLQGTDYPESGYNHSGWLSEDGNYYYMGDETWGTPLKVFDVSDLKNILYKRSFDAGNDSPFSFSHNQIVACDYLYSSYYYDGLQVFDISIPEDPQRVLQVPTSTLMPQANYEGAWGVFPFLPSGNILISDMQNGLFVVQAVDTRCNLLAEVQNENLGANISIVPNPNDGKFQLISDEKVQQLSIFNMAGRLIFRTSNLQNTAIQLTDIRPGIYVAEMKIENGRKIEKIIIHN